MGETESGSGYQPPDAPLSAETSDETDTGDGVADNAREAGGLDTEQHVATLAEAIEAMGYRVLERDTTRIAFDHFTGVATFEVDGQGNVKLQTNLRTRDGRRAKQEYANIIDQLRRVYPQWTVTILSNDGTLLDIDADYPKPDDPIESGPRPGAVPPDQQDLHYDTRAGWYGTPKS